MRLATVMLFFLFRVHLCAPFFFQGLFFLFLLYYTWMDLFVANAITLGRANAPNEFLLLT